MTNRIYFLVTMMLFAPLTLSANESSSGLSWDLRGFTKTVSGYERLRQENLYSGSSNGLAEQFVRINSNGHWGPFRLDLSNEIVLSHRTVGSPTVNLARPSAYWNPEWQLVDQGNNHTFYRLDRAFLELTLSDVELIIGKQVVSTGVARIFSATSQTPRLTLVQLDNDFEQTQDAIALILQKPWQLEFRYLPAWSSQTLSNFHVRSLAKLPGIDFAFILGRAEGKPFLGAGIEMDWNGSIIRADTALYRDQNATLSQIVLGIERALSRSWTAMNEFYYNGFGGSDYSTTPRLITTAYRGRLYWGTVVRWEITPLLRTELQSIVNVSDPSAFIHFTVSYNVMDNVDLRVGQYLGIAGGKTSEFGQSHSIALSEVGAIKAGLSDVTYASLKVAF